MTSSNTNIFNEAADFLFYEIGANPIPADTKYKRINIRWGDFQDKSVPIKLHVFRKEKGEYDNGIAVMTGRINKGKNKGKFLIGIDCDNKKAIEEICNSLGFKDINKLANWTWVEQHKDNSDKAHIYILSTKSFKNKGRDPKKVETESLNEIPELEIKGDRQTMITAPSLHEDGYPYEILGTREPVLCDEVENHLDNIFRKYGIEYLHNSSEQNNNNSTLPDPLRQLTLLLEIPPDFKFRIHQGSRHNTMVSFANKLLFKYKFDNNNNGNKLKDFFNEVNDKLCIPPLPQNELNNIWRDALKFSDKKFAEMQIVNEDEDDIQNYKSPIVVQLDKSDKLLHKEIVQNFVYDIQTNSIDCTLNSKYDLTKIIVPINIKQWPDVRKTFRKLCEEKGIKEDDICLLLESIDNNADLIKKYYLENNRKHNAAVAATEERKKQRLQLIQEGTDFVMAKYRFSTVEESNEILFYDSNKGVYTSGGHIIIDKEIDKKYGYKLKTADITEIRNYVRRKTYIKLQEFDSNIDIINLRNGLYNWKTGEFFPHTPDYYSLNQKPIVYNPKARSKYFIKFLKEVLWTDDILTAIDIIAYTFLKYNLHEYYFILIGVGANGKSVFTGLVTNLHGLKNVSNVSLNSLVTNRFALAALENKDVNIDTELSSATIKDISILKKLTGKQPITIEKKGIDPYDTILHAKQIFNANQMPNIPDSSDARYRREIPLSFPFQFEGARDDPELLNKLSTEEELSAILNIITIALKRITKNGGGIYLNQKTIKERREKAELINNPIKSFLNDAISEDSIESDYEIKEDVYRAYTRFCKYHKLPMQSYETFGEILKKDYNYKKDRKRINSKKQTVWAGIKLVKWNNNDPLQQTLLEESDDDNEGAEEDNNNDNAK